MGMRILRVSSTGRKLEFLLATPLLTEGCNYQCSSKNKYILNVAQFANFLSQSGFITLLHVFAVLGTLYKYIIFILFLLFL